MLYQSINNFPIGYVFLVEELTILKKKLSFSCGLGEFRVHLLHDIFIVYSFVIHSARIFLKKETENSGILLRILNHNK